MALPFGFSNTTAAYQHALRGRLADQITIQLPPVVNTLHLGWSPGAHLQTIPEETPGSESQGSTETLAETFFDQFLLPPFRGGTIFNVSIDSPPRNGEIEERAAWENRNVNRAQRRENEVAIARAEAARNSRLDS